MDNTTLTVIAKLKAKEGMEDRVKQGLSSIISPSRQEQGNVSYDVFQSESDPTIFFTHECWISKDALESHTQTSHFQQFGAESKELLAQPIEGNLLNQVG